ncbi:MAG TPA: Ldh family oxidoreductase [Burkholderiales bacterium]|jgi:LDH2 family malate/lactate/ureidoglycolate dehydrogenase
MRISVERLERWVATIFSAEGLPEEHALTVAKVLIFANLRGMDTHGVLRVPSYVRFIHAGDLNPRPAMSARSEAPACVLLEADRAAGPVAMQRATDLAMDKARQAGVGVCLVRATTHTGALGYYTQMAAERGMAAIAFSSSTANMAYHGARAAGVSTAPLALAVPGEQGPIALDMASSIMSMGKLRQAKRAGTPLDEGQALDKDGNPTTDAEEAAILLPLGGAKGSGLSLLIECMTSLLAGNPLLAEVLERTELGARHRQNGAVIALDLARFVDPAEFRRQAGRLARAIKALPPQPGMEILLPGERGTRAAEERLRDGIPLPDAVLDELRNLMEEPS